jgi:hypothetical protein
MADWITEKNERVERARGPFERLCLGRMTVSSKSSVADRVRAALWALHDWRQVNNQQERGEEEAALAVRIVAESMASEIAATAGESQDPGTIAWVVAGLRCPRQPFCRGCDACYTVDAPHRADVQFTATGSNPGGAS